MEQNSNHGGHDKMMWLMMLMCIVPSFVILLSGYGVKKIYVILFLLACVGGHFLIRHRKKSEVGGKGESGKGCH